MAYVKCMDCGYEKHGIATVEEARRLAVIHYQLSSCLLCFGYEDGE